MDSSIPNSLAGPCNENGTLYAGSHGSWKISTLVWALLGLNLNVHLVFAQCAQALSVWTWQFTRVLKQQAEPFISPEAKNQVASN